MIFLTRKPILVASRHSMDGIPPERRAVRPLGYLCLLLIAQSVLPVVGFGQSILASGTQGGASTVSYHILDQRRAYFGQHSVTYNFVSPPVFPVRVAAAEPTPVPLPLQQSGQPVTNFELLLCGATVYDSQYSVIQWLDGNNDLTIVSNVDFDLFTTCEGFVAGDTYYELIIALDDESSANADPVTLGWLTQARNILPAGTPGYIVVTGTAGPDDIQALNGLDACVAASGQQLANAYQKLQAQNAAALLRQKLHPKSRPDTVVYYWPIKSSVYLTGSGQ